MFLEFVDFVNANPILIIIGLIGIAVWNYFEAKNQKKFRATMYDRTQTQETDHKVLVTRFDNLESKVDDIQDNINDGLAEHIKQTHK